MEETKENIVMFPFMAQGHIIPFLALALQIEKTKRNYTITFVNTPQNIKKLKNSLPLSSSNIHLVEIPFDSTLHGLPPNTENSDILPYPLIIKLLDSSSSLKPSFTSLIKDITQQHGKPPLCIIADIFFGWTVNVAKELGVFHAIFSSSGAFGLACYYSVWSSLPHRNVESDEFELEDFKEASKLHKTQLPVSILEADGSDSWSVFQHKNLPAWVDSNGFLFNTVEEFDHVGLSYFRRKLGKPAWVIGPVLLSNENPSRAGKVSGISQEILTEWLDSKPEKSVLFVSFGTQNTISASQMMQLAVGLEKSGKNFIWVIRPPIGFAINSEFQSKQWLPEGFEQRINESKRGLLVHQWAPQVEILSHKSTGAFLSHCGWNSVLESLNFGVPLIGWAMAGEQFFNVKFLEEDLGVCMELARGKSYAVRYEDIKAKIELVMGDSDEGKEIRRKTCEVQKMMKNAVRSENGCIGSSVKALDDFFQAAISAGEEKVSEVGAMRLN